MVNNVEKDEVSVILVSQPDDGKMQILKLILGRGMFITLIGAVVGVIGSLFLSPLVAQLFIQRECSRSLDARRGNASTRGCGAARLLYACAPRHEG